MTSISSWHSRNWNDMKCNRRRLAAEFGGRKNFWMTFFCKKISFQRLKFLMTAFSQRPYFLMILPLFTVFNLIYNIYGSFLYEKPLFRKKVQKFLHDTFLKLSSYFHTHPITLLLEILGGRMHGPSSHLKFLWGTVPLPIDRLCISLFLRLRFGGAVEVWSQGLF